MRALRLFGWPLVAAATVLAGCEQAAPEQAIARRSAPLPQSASPERGCNIPAALPPGGIPAVDTSMTPRGNVAAEILAMEASGELVAPQDLYERVAQELRVLSGHTVFGCGVDSDLLIAMTPDGIAEVQNGQYTAWNDYNDALRVTATVARYNGYKLEFDGIYNHAALAQAYGALPEVTSAERNGWVGGSSDVCLERFGDANDTHVYILWSGSGDCPAGCINQSYHGYSAEASGAVEYLGFYGGTGAEPDWFAKAQQCRNFL